MDEQQPTGQTGATETPGRVETGQSHWILPTKTELVKLNPVLAGQLQAIGRTPDQMLTPDRLAGHFDALNEAVTEGKISEADAAPFLAKISDRVAQLEAANIPTDWAIREEELKRDFQKRLDEIAGLTREVQEKLAVEMAARQVLEERAREQDRLLTELKEDKAARQKEREEIERRLAGLTAEERAGTFGGMGLGILEHPKTRAGEKLLGLEDLRASYAATINKEIDKMERRKPLPYDSWRTLWLIDYIEQISTRKELNEVMGAEAADELSAEFLDYLDMREAIWNRVCWHERSLGFMKVICAEDSPQPSAEQLAEFENDPYRPEIRVAIASFMKPEVSRQFTFPPDHPDPTRRGQISTPYAEAMMVSGAENDLYRKIETEIINRTSELTGGKTKLRRTQAARIRQMAEDYLRATGWISTLDPAMQRNINDNVNEGMFGGTRNRKRTDEIKPAGPPYAAGLFVDRLEIKFLPQERNESEEAYKDRCRKKALESSFGSKQREPLILLEGNKLGECQYMGHFYEAMGIKAKISANGRTLTFSYPGSEYSIPIEGVGIRGKPLATKEEEIIVEEGGNRRRVEVRSAEPNIRGKKVSLRLIDIMTNLDTKEVKPLRKEIWKFIDNSVFGSFLLGWAKASELGFYGLTSKPQWETKEVIDYSALQPLYHTIRWLMGASPLVNVLTNEKDEAPEEGNNLLVKINRKGEVCFGKELSEREKRGEEFLSRKEVHELIMARLIATAVSTFVLKGKTRIGSGSGYITGKFAEGTYMKQLKDSLLRNDGIDHLHELLFEPRFSAPPILTTRKAIDEVEDRLKKLK